MTFWCLFEFQEQFGSAKVDQKLWISDFLLLNRFLTARKLCVVVIRKCSLVLHSASVLSACEQIFTAPSSLWNAIDTQLSVTAVWLIHNTAVVLMANKSYDLLDSSSMRFLVLTFIMQYHWLIETGGLLPVMPKTISSDIWEGRLDLGHMDAVFLHILTDAFVARSYTQWYRIKTTTL